VILEGGAGVTSGERESNGVKADFAFVLHALSYLSAKGRAAIACCPGIFYRAVLSKKSESTWWITTMGKQ
jgi:hypothetical protein